MQGSNSVRTPSLPLLALASLAGASSLAHAGPVPSLVVPVQIDVASANTSTTEDAYPCTFANFDFDPAVNAGVKFVYTAASPVRVPDAGTELVVEVRALRQEKLGTFPLWWVEGTHIEGSEALNQNAVAGTDAPALEPYSGNESALAAEEGSSVAIGWYERMATVPGATAWTLDGFTVHLPTALNTAGTYAKSLCYVWGRNDSVAAAKSLIAFEAGSGGDTDVADTDVADTDVADTDVSDTDVVDTEVSDTDIADTDLTDTNAGGTDSDVPQADSDKDKGCGCNSPAGAPSALALAAGLIALARRRRK